MIRKAKSLAVVVPCYNEEATIHEFHKQVCAVLDTLDISYGFVFVDDGSRDNTLTVLNTLASTDSRVSVLSLARNFGHQLALTAGLDHADAEIIVTMDCDLQHPPATLAEMVRAYEGGADVVYAVRENDENRGFLKSWAAGTFYTLLKRMTRTEVISGAVDFRLLSREALEVLRSMREVHRYLRGMVPWMGFPSAMVHYHQQERFAGTSSYSWRQLARLARHGLFSFSTIPLAFITWLGVLMNVLAVMYLIYILLAAAFSDTLRSVPGWSSVIVVLLVVSGVQLISIGILAQYIGMIFEQVKGRPLYVLKQKRLQSHDFRDRKSHS
ncbi:MAG: glycosyltransferase family 2 protein [Anaerolineae bacterium]|nr:glycosyltransferase family 2 protein [Anaerolineae bacterium]